MSNVKEAILYMEYNFSFFIIAAAMVFSGISKAGLGSGASFAGASLLSI